MQAEVDASMNHRSWRKDSNHHPSGLRLPGRVQRSYLVFRRVVEFFLALLLLVLVLPLMLLASLLIKLTSRGPAVYTQVRIGKLGRHYRIYKLRTMIDNCEKASGPQWATAGDPRITRIGRFLRRTHLDELPQLWNVLLGDMSLVGPRPERPEFLPALEEVLPHYGDRLQVRPGMTGLAQVQLPADTDLASVRRKLAYDLYYVRRIGPWLDLRILFCTALYLAGLPCHLMQRYLLIPRRGVVENHYQSVTTQEPNLVPQMQSA